MIKKILAVIGVFVVAGVAYWIGYSQGKTNTQELVRENLYPNGNVPSEELVSFGGKVLEVKENAILMVGPKPQNALSEWPDERLVKITPDTVIMKVETLPNEEFNRLLEEYNRKLRNIGTDPNNPPVAPSPVRNTKISLSDIKEGDIVTVVSKIDIALEKEFEISELYLNILSPLPQ